MNRTAFPAAATILAAAAALSACSPAPEQTVEPANAANTADNAATPASKTVATVPENFQGKWGLTPADCTGSGAGGRMTVADTKLTFDGSSATASEIVAVGPDVLNATLAYKNKQGGWKSPTKMMLQDDGKTLVRDDTHPAGRFRYERCAA